MPLRLIVGRANAGKTGRAYDEVKSAVASGRDAVLLLPSEPDVTRAAGELARSHALGIRCVQMGRYLSQLWSQLGDGRREVTALQRRLLLTAAAKEAGVGGKGMVRLAERCARELAEQTGGAWRRDVPQDLGAGSELAALLSGYGAQLEARSLVEPAEAVHMLAEADRHSADVVVAHRFTDFTPAQEAFLVGSAAGGCDVTITLNWEDGFAPTEALTDLVRRLEVAGAEIQVVTAVEGYGTAEELLALEAGLFVSPQPLRPRGAVRLATAEGPEAEAQVIGAEVRRLIEEESVNPDQIAVVFRAPERHGELLGEALRDLGIAADFDVPQRFKAVSFGRAFCGLLSFAIGGDRTALLSFLRTRFSGAERDTLAALEARWRRHGITTAGELRRSAQGLGSGVKNAIELADWCARAGVDRGSAPEWAALVNVLLGNGFGRTAGALAASSEADARAASLVNRLLGDVVELEAQGVSAAEFLDVVTEQMLRADGRERPGHVQVTGVTRMRARRFDAVVLGGLNADEFPARPAEEMLPGSAVGRVIEAFGGRPAERLGDPYERLLCYQILTRPRRFLVLEASTADASGEIMQVSPLLEEVLDFYRVDDGLSLETRHRSLAQVPEAGAGLVDRDELRVAAFTGDSGEPRVAAAQARSAPREGSALSSAAVAELAERSTFSPSEIETYLACPYRWFYERAVRAEELDREFGIVDEGSLAHDLLAEVYRRAPELMGRARVTPANLSAALSAVERLHAEQVAAAEGAPLPERLSRQAVLGWAQRLLSDDASFLPGFAPLHIEWSFEDTRIEPGGYALAGRVDRVDVDAEGRAVVIDYKRSGVTKAAEIVPMGKVQLPLYAAAVEARLGVQVVGGVYRALVRRDDRGVLLAGAVDGPGLCSRDFLDAEQFSALREEAMALAAEAVAGIRAGRIPCAPRTTSACTFCRAAVTCGGGA